jgi:hypothetical protein
MDKRISIAAQIEAGCQDGCMVSVMDQLPALLGVLVGTGGTILATWAADRARWRRQQSARWDERRLQAYVDYANALKEVHSVAMRMVGPRTRPGLSDSDRQELLLTLTQADLRRTTTWESVLLLGDAATVTAARGWHAAVAEVARHAQHPAAGDFDVIPAVTRVNDNRDRFYEAARSSLGITAQFAPQSEWLAKELGAAAAPSVARVGYPADPWG